MLPCSFSIDQYAIWYSQDLYYEARALVLGFIHHWISNLSISFGASVEIGTLIMWKILDPKWITTVLADVNLLEKVAWSSKNPTSTHLGPCPGLALPHVSGCLNSLHDSYSSPLKNNKYSLLLSIYCVSSTFGTKCTWIILAQFLQQPQ